MTEDVQLRLFKAQITRLRESVKRLEAYSALQMNHDALRDEITFAGQVISAMQIQNVPCHAFDPGHSDACPCRRY